MLATLDFFSKFQEENEWGKIEKEIKQLGVPQLPPVKAFSFRMFTGPF